MTTLLSFIVVIGIIVFVHELGHFLAAKLSGVRVETFSLGFPPRMFSRKIGETVYQICWVPLGGFVKMTGMVDESFDDDFDADDPRAFTSQSFPKRAFIITAGVMMNIVLAFVIYSVLTFANGVGMISGTKVSQVAAESPAATAGIESGDEITAVAGVEITEWRELTEIVQRNPAIPIEVVWKRSGSVFRSEIIPEVRESLNIETGRRDTIGVLGVIGTMTMQPVNALQAVGYGVAQVVGILDLNIISLKWLLTGQARIGELTGPLGIAKMSGDSAKSGLSSFVAFIAYISVSIGFLNILPIPMLDGGHLGFMIVEAVIRRSIPEKVKMNLMKAGLAALLLLILVVSYHDVLRFFAK